MAGPIAKSVTPNALMRCRSTPLRLSTAWEASAVDHPLKGGSMLHRDVSVDEKLPGFGLCGNCDLGKLELVDERPHPMLGVAGKVIRTLRCDAAGCGSYLVETD